MSDLKLELKDLLNKERFDCLFFNSISLWSTEYYNLMLNEFIKREIPPI